MRVLGGLKGDCAVTWQRTALIRAVRFHTGDVPAVVQ